MYVKNVMYVKKIKISLYNSNFKLKKVLRLFLVIRKPSNLEKEVYV